MASSKQPSKKTKPSTASDAPAGSADASQTPPQKLSGDSFPSSNGDSTAHPGDAPFPTADANDTFPNGSSAPAAESLPNIRELLKPGPHADAIHRHLTYIAGQIGASAFAAELAAAALSFTPARNSTDQALQATNAELSAVLSHASLVEDRLHHHGMISTLVEVSSRFADDEDTTLLGAHLEDSSTRLADAIGYLVDFAANLGGRSCSSPLEQAKRRSAKP